MVEEEEEEVEGEVEEVEETVDMEEEEETVDIEAEEETVEAEEETAEAEMFVVAAAGILRGAMIVIRIGVRVSRHRGGVRTPSTAGGSATIITGRKTRIVVRTSTLSGVVRRRSRLILGINLGPDLPCCRLYSLSLMV